MKIIQCASGESVPLLDLTASRHADYCTARNYTYVRSAAFGGSPYWDKARLMQQELGTAADGEVVLWIDADAWIANTNVDLAGVLPDGYDMAMKDPATLGRYHSGVWGVKKSTKTTAFMEGLLALQEGKVKIDATLSSYMATNTDISINTIGDEWHEYIKIIYPPPMVERWRPTIDAMHGTIQAVHSVPKKFALTMMQYALARP